MPDRRTLIVVPTYNERDNLPSLVDAVLSAVDSVDVLIVDDASPDGTGRIADDLAASNPRVHVIHRPTKLGVGSAYVAGFRRGIDDGYEVLIQMDGDMSHDPRFLPALIDAIDDGADVVVGSRNIPDGGVEGWGITRQMLSRGGSRYSRTVLGIDVHDLTTGFKAYRRRALEVIGFDSVRSDGYAFQIETTYRAICRGLRVVEIPIVFVDRRVGHSKMTSRAFLQAVSIPWRLRLDAVLQRL
jgi:dolichol-phosphate mannosyltransferase